jgi:hypothetical protein
MKSRSIGGVATDAAADADVAAETEFAAAGDVGIDAEGAAVDGVGVAEGAGLKVLAVVLVTALVVAFGGATGAGSSCG